MEQNTEKYILPNGLIVILQSNHFSPVISINIGIKVGSAWEKNSEAGLSHVLEHMVFKGTKSYGPGEISNIVESCGGDLNAYTSFDQTVYYINLPSRHWATGLGLIQEMCFEAKLDPLELSREKEVILEELRKGRDDPHRYLGQMLFSLAYKKHPYGRPIIGFEQTIKNMSEQDVSHFYHNWYVPNNMVLGICGDFNENELRDSIEKLFSKYPSHEIVKPFIQSEPHIIKSRILTKPREIEGYYMSLAYPIPHFTHQDIPALDVLAQVLGQGETSLLVRSLKDEKKLVNHIQAYTYTPVFPGLFLIDVLLNKKSVARIFPILLEELHLCWSERIAFEQVERVKNNIKSSIYYEKETCEGIARKWIMYETTASDFRYEEEYMKAVSQVTPKDLKRVALTYLPTHKSISALIHPKKHKISFQKPSVTLLHKIRHQAQNQLYKKISEYENIHQYSLPNGLKIILRENHRVPLVSIKTAALGGLRLENTKNNGLSYLTSNLIDKGTATKSAQEIARIIENISGHIQGYSGRNSWGLSSSFLSDKLECGLDLFCDVLTNPSFDQEEFNKEKKLTLEAIKNQNDSLPHVTFNCFLKLLYTKHPYGMPVIGSQKTVRTLTRSQVVHHYQRILQPQQMVISAVGAFESETLIHSLAQKLGHLKNQTNFIPKHKNEKRSKSIRLKEISKNKIQAHIVLGFLGTTFKNQDRYALEVLNSVLAGMGGRLFLELRDRQSLAYTVSSHMVEGLEPGYLAVYMGTEPKKVPTAIQGILAELTKIRSHKIEQAELLRAQHYIVGNHEIELQRNSAVASLLTFDCLYGFNLSEFKDFSEKILAVSADDVLKVAQTYLNPNAYCLAVVKPD